MNVPKKRLAIIGSKDLAMQIANHALNTNLYEIVGFLDDYEKVNSIVNGKIILGKIDDAISLYSNGVFDCVFIALGYSLFDLKKEVYNKIKNKIPLASIISPSAIIDKSAIIGEGVLISPGCIVDKNVTIKDNVCIFMGSIIAHEDIIEEHSFISANVTMAGFVKVGKRCFLGIGTLICDNVSVSDDVWICAGTTVSNNIISSGRYCSKSLGIIKIT